MKIIQGKRDHSGCKVTVSTGTGKPRSLPLRLNWANKSPTGFEWGYAGSGPAQLALAILGQFLPKERALRLYQSFKFAKVAGLPHDGWTMSEEEITTWIAEQAPTMDEAPEA